MPTVLTVGPYRLFFYSADRAERPHIHVARDSAVAKYWLDPVRHQKSTAFRQPELRKIQRIVSDRREQLLEAWDEFFGQ
jgi:hypothetical protein